MAFAHKPIETVGEAHTKAKKVLPKDVYSALQAGSDSGATMKGNLSAFEEIGMIPRVGGEIPRHLDLAATFMGQPIELPVVIAPAAAFAMLDTTTREITYCRVPYDVEAAADRIR